MTITERGDYSLVIQEDASDREDFKLWNTLDSIVKGVELTGRHILVDSDPTQLTYNYIVASDYLYSEGMLILFFKDVVPDRFSVHNQVLLCLSGIY